MTFATPKSSRRSTASIVQRNVELGQTVAASLQAPTLFLIADDLRRMEIAANIDETDVGRIKPGQRVTFTVTAYPGRTFEGSVKQVRLGSQTVQNVVIYTTIVSIENPRLELLPGMTANLRIETDRRENVVRIPNAALRWRPPSIVPDAAPASAHRSRRVTRKRRRGGNGGDARSRNSSKRSKPNSISTAAQTKEIDAAIDDMRKSFRRQCRRRSGSGAPRTRPRRAPGPRGAHHGRAQCRAAHEIRRDQEAPDRTQGSGRTQVGRVFVTGKDGKPQGVTVRIGATDGGMTEIVSGLEAGREVIIGGGPRADAATRGPRFGF